MQCSIICFRVCSYFDAQIGLSNAIRDKQITMVKIYKALGGGW